MKTIIQRALSILLLALSFYVQADDNTVRFMHVSSDRTHVAYYVELVAKFRSKYPEYNVQIENIMDHEMKRIMEPMLQSNHKPNVIHSWGGADLATYARRGWIANLNGYSNDLEATISEGGLKAFEVDEGLYGYPATLQQVGIWYNKQLFRDAGVSESQMQTWQGFIEGVKQLKAAGITPIALGGADQWPIHFYWSYLAMRTGGLETFKQVTRGQANWLNADYLQASELFYQLAELEPFQDNFETYSYGEASKVFGDHQAAMQLMGDWDVSVQRSESENGQGVTNRDLGFMPFPIVQGGQGKITDTLGGVNGWIVPIGKANEATLAWLEFLLSKDTQSREAKLGKSIPVLKGLAGEVKDSFKADIARRISESTWHQIYWDQALGADVGGTINQISFDLATLTKAPRAANQAIQNAWDNR